MTTPSEHESHQPRGADQADDLDGSAVIGQGADGDTAARKVLRDRREVDSTEEVGGGH